MDCDFLVIGAGVAGLRAAIELAKCGSVLVIAKDSLRESSSEYAQGGIAVALSDDDEVALHEQDTLYAGDGLCDPEAVRTLVEEGPAAIQELIDWGAEFDREGARSWLSRAKARTAATAFCMPTAIRPGARSRARCIRKAASLPHIRFESYSAITDLLLAGGRAGGRRGLRGKTPACCAMCAPAPCCWRRAVSGRVFKETTNPDVATGDGVAMAWRAGAEIANIEFVQFHPTALHVEGAPRFLLSEALRGEGALLRNKDGEAFMERYHPMMDLAPRDVVSRSIVAEMRRTGSPHVWLDLTARDADFIRRRFPRIYETCLALRRGYRARSPRPCIPRRITRWAACRRIWMGAARCPGLYAAGEVACTGVHGANRLASNSLLEALVFGARAGRAMSAHADEVVEGSAGTSSRCWRPRLPKTELRELTWEYCGITRDRNGLEAAVNALDRAIWEAVGEPSLRVVELRNMHEVAGLIARCALWREESRGAHYRTDFPEKREEFQRASAISRPDISVRLVP